MSHHIDIAAGNRLRTLRIEKGKSQVELAEGLTISYQQIQKYETGANRISLSRAYGLARVLKVPVERLICGLDGVQGARDKSTGSERLELEVVRALRQIQNEGTRRQVLKLTKTLVPPPAVQHAAE